MAFKDCIISPVQTLEGNAWHADHVIPVYKGGGMCQLDNLRTLCVPCHQVSAAPAHACHDGVLQVVVLHGRLGMHVMWSDLKTCIRA